MNGRLVTLGLLVTSVGYAVFVVWQEWSFRQNLPSPMSFAAPIATQTSPVPLDTTAVLTVFGLAAESHLLPSAEPLTLQASFVLDAGLSRALLADGQGSRIYQVGDQLPGGSVLRRVEVNRAVLWNKGREEVLTLQMPAARFLRRFDSPTESQVPVKSARYLRPHSGQSE
ncbi:TPA: hypothetical protein SAN82_002840 [Pseudomonas putida]|nr:hypothetical protein [Pseudomonas putida]